jgi:hypothetical protein
MSQGPWAATETLEPELVLEVEVAVDRALVLELELPLDLELPLALELPPFWSKIVPVVIGLAP